MNRLEVFNKHRALLFAIAYRMLSSVADAHRSDAELRKVDVDVATLKGQRSGI